MQAILVAAALLVPTLAYADDPPLRMSVEVDPADYTVYHGWGGFIGIHPDATGPWRFRVGGGAASLQIGRASCRERV